MHARRTGPVLWLGCALLSLISAFLLVYAASILKDQIYGIDSTEDVFFTLLGLFFGGVAVWGIATIYGLLRVRRWGTTSALWVGRALFVVPLPGVAWYANVVKTAPDVGWSWQALFWQIPFIGAGALLVFVFSGPRR